MVITLLLLLLVRMGEHKKDGKKHKDKDSKKKKSKKEKKSKKDKERCGKLLAFASLPTMFISI